VLLNQVYELYEFDPIGFQFTHDPFTIVTVPIVHTLCGVLTYTSTFDGNDISSTSSAPIQYFAGNLTHDVYSEDQSLIDTTNGQNIKQYTVTAFLTQWISTVSEVATANIEFKNPCPDPESVTAPVQTNPAAYLYTAQAPKMQFTMIPFVVEPDICKVTYSCAMTAGPRVDLCAKTDGSTHGVFDPITGNY